MNPVVSLVISVHGLEEPLHEVPLSSESPDGVHRQEEPGDLWVLVIRDVS